MTDKTRILVVDDEEIVCASVRRILAREGYVVDTAMNVSDALARAAEKNYALVITDLMMPEKNGVEMMHELRDSGNLAPFVMITGYPTIKTAMQALRLGAIDYIPKPFTRQELLGPVNRALRHRETGEPAPVPAVSPAQAEPVMPGERFVLPGHSWAVYNQDGIVAVGIEESFLQSAGPVVKISCPGVNEMVEQGYPNVTVETADRGEHGVFMPFSGRVVAIQDELLQKPGALTASSWILQVIPADLQAEALMLVKKK